MNVVRGSRVFVGGRGRSLVPWRLPSPSPPPSPAKRNRLTHVRAANRGQHRDHQPDHPKRCFRLLEEESKRSHQESQRQLDLIPRLAVGGADGVFIASPLAVGKVRVVEGLAENAALRQLLSQCGCIVWRKVSEEEGGFRRKRPDAERTQLLAQLRGPDARLGQAVADLLLVLQCRESRRLARRAKG